MELIERELIERVIDRDPELKKLCDKHKKIEKELEHYGRYAPYSYSAAMREQELKKIKLKDKEKIVKILTNYKED